MRALGFIVLVGISFLQCSQSRDKETEDSTAVHSTSKATVAFLWMFHFESKNNVFTQKFNDVLSEPSQADILALVQALKKYNPTKIAVERPYYTMDVLNDRYHQYLKGEYQLTKEETDQIAFRLGKELGHDSLFVVSYSGDFPLDEVRRFAIDHGQSKHYEEGLSYGRTLLHALDSVLQNGSLIDGIKYMNTDSAQRLNHMSYYPLLKIGNDSARVGTELLTSWYKTNFIIYNNIVDITEAGDRVLVIYGQGHSIILSRLFMDNPEISLLDVSEYIDGL